MSVGVGDGNPVVVRNGMNDVFKLGAFKKCVDIENQNQVVVKNKNNENSEFGIRNLIFSAVLCGCWRWESACKKNIDNNLQFGMRNQIVFAVLQNINVGNENPVVNKIATRI